MSACICERVVFETDTGEKIDGVMRPHADCPTHGRPDDIWRAGDPLRRHMKLIDLDYGDRVTPQEARRRAPHPLGGYSRRRFREETPRETEARLIAEANGEWSPLMPIVGLA